MHDTKKILNAIRDYFNEFDEISFAYLFGSFGSEFQTKFSDIDIAIYQTEQKSSYGYRMTEFKAEAELSRLYPELKFDVRSFNDAPIMVVGKIIDEGKVIFVRDKNFHLNFVELNRLKYMDYQIIYKPLFNYRLEHLLND